MYFEFLGNIVKISHQCSAKIGWLTKTLISKKYKSLIHLLYILILHMLCTFLFQLFSILTTELVLFLSLPGYY